MLNLVSWVGLIGVTLITRAILAKSFDIVEMKECK